MVRKGNAVLIFMLIAIAAYSQIAPQLVVTDSEGETHDLYADYLNQGKTVMINIFFSTCPPCRAMAPSIGELYVAWGAGEADVEFLNISRQNWETNATVERYKADFGLTFPHISAEGGGVEAFETLTNAGFGQYFGSPLYIVIAPSGDVQWDVAGIGVNGTIRELEFAFSETGATKPTTTSTTSLDTSPLKVWPNPVHETLYVSMHQTAELELHWSIVFPDGRQMGMEMDRMSSTVFQTSIGHLPQGPYALTVRTQDGQKSAKFVKN